MRSTHQAAEGSDYMESVVNLSISLNSVFSNSAPTEQSSGVALQRRMERYYKSTEPMLEEINTCADILKVTMHMKADLGRCFWIFWPVLRGFMNTYITTDTVKS